MSHKLVDRALKRGQKMRGQGGVSKLITEQLMAMIEKDDLREIHCSQNVIDAVCLETTGETSNPQTAVSIYGAVLVPTNTLRPGLIRVYRQRGILRNIKGARDT